jgi:hypothetical protein
MDWLNRKCCYLDVNFLCKDQDSDTDWNGYVTLSLETPFARPAHSDVRNDIILAYIQPSYTITPLINTRTIPGCRSQLPRGLRHRSAAACLLILWIRIPSAAWMFVCSERCVLWGTGLCDGLITRPEKFYRVWCVWVWSRNLKNEAVLAHWGAFAPKTNNNRLLTQLLGSH